MRIGAIQRFSMIDYPGQLAAIIFTQGCNFRCPYCHNPELVNFDLLQEPLSENEILAFLESRKGKLDAVCITGGEPTLHPDLPEFIAKIKEMGFLVKLDTNGTNPELLNFLIENKLVDYVAMDIKAPLNNYYKVTKTQVDVAKLKKSIEILQAAEIEYEFRSTLISTLHSEEDLLEMAKSISKSKRYFLQKFVPTKTLDESFKLETTFSDEKFRAIRSLLENEIEDIQVR